MLITCTGCNTTMRVPGDAAGKVVKCPKCALRITVPSSEQPSEAETTGVSSTPLPPLPHAEPPPQEPADPDAFSTTPMTGGAKPPPIKAKGDAFDDDDDDGPPQNRRRRDDDEDDDEFDDLDVRNRRGGARNNNGMALASMILGISALASSFASCCNCMFFVYAIIGGVLAIIFGFQGKTPGNEAYAWTGILCGGGAFVVLVLMFVIGVLIIGADLGLNLR